MAETELEGREWWLITSPGPNEKPTPPATGLYALETLVYFDRGEILQNLSPGVLVGFIVGSIAFGLAATRFISQPEWLRAKLGALAPESVRASSLPGEPITARLTRAPGNGASIGGLKVVAESGWFAARPSGTENIYKIYAESFRDEAHLEKIVSEAQEIVHHALTSTAGKA